jgi:hypothetical protein
MARLGELDLGDDDDGATPTDLLIVNRKVHEEYNPTTFVNDISILRLENDVIFTGKFIARCSEGHVSFVSKPLPNSNRVNFNIIQHNIKEHNTP